MIKSEVKTLQLQFIDPAGTKVTYALTKPKDDLDKAAIDAAAKSIIDAKAFATKNGDLASLEEGRVVTHKVEIVL